jgi:hypothetical protein
MERPGRVQPVISDGKRMIGRKKSPLPDAADLAPQPRWARERPQRNRLKDVRERREAGRRGGPDAAQEPRVPGARNDPRWADFFEQVVPDRVAPETVPGNSDGPQSRREEGVVRHVGGRGHDHLDLARKVGHEVDRAPLVEVGLLAAVPKAQVGVAVISVLEEEQGVRHSGRRPSASSRRTATARSACAAGTKAWSWWCAAIMLHGMPSAASAAATAAVRPTPFRLSPSAPLSASRRAGRYAPSR